MNTPLNEPVVTVLLETPFFDVIDINDGTRPVGKGYKVVKEPKAVNGVVVLPVLADGRIALASLMRRAIGQVSIEAPRGKIDDDETPEQAAERELLEELGMKALKVTLVGKLHSNTSLLSSSVAVCVASVSGEVESETDGEVEHTMIKSMREIKAMIGRGEITDGHTLSALMILICKAED